MVMITLNLYSATSSDGNPDLTQLNHKQIKWFSNVSENMQIEYEMLMSHIVELFVL